MIYKDFIKIIKKEIIVDDCKNVFRNNSYFSGGYSGLTNR